MNYLGKDYNIKINTDITSALIKFFATIGTLDGNKTLVLEQGKYFISSKFCDKATYYITNTIGEKEYYSTETPYLHTIGIHLSKIKDLTIEGNGSEIILEGVMTNIVVSNCENITFNNLIVKTLSPNIHKMTVKKVAPFYVDFELNDNSKYEKCGSDFFFVGEGYRLNFKFGAMGWGYFIKTFNENPKRVRRSLHPFLGSFKIKELSKNNFRAYYLKHKSFSVDESYFLYDTRRIEVGVFIECSKNIKFENYSQNFNYSLALVCQDSENLYFDKLDLSNKEYGVASLADFVQLCMCRGEIKITNSYFSGAGDDILNIHGFHFEIKSIDGNNIQVQFRHPQSFGFNAFRPGDVVEVVKKKTLLTGDNCKVVSAKTLTPYIIELELDKPLNCQVNDCIENIDANPTYFLYQNNIADRIVTRGLLITTRAKVEILDNTFDSTCMSGILISDDANNWFESGLVKDVLIKGNKFVENYDQCILVLPENSEHSGAVHNNIKIIENEFTLQQQKCFRIKSTDNIEIKHNVFKGNKHKTLIYLKNVNGLVTDISNDQIKTN